MLGDAPTKITNSAKVKEAFMRTFQKEESDFYSPTFAQDDVGMKEAISYERGMLPDDVLFWYSSQSFIGYNACALLSQHWLIDKACTVPAREATRKGYEINVSDGQEIDEEVMDYIRKQDKRFKINAKMVEFIRKSRIFGIRIAMFKVESTDPNYYLNPFNIDGVKKGSYKGMSQIDPYWCAPELDTMSAADPSSIHFYEPTYWIINGKRIHRTHLVIAYASEVVDILKPTYLYGGISIPQKVFSRVYAAERVSDEAPQLAMTKRTTILKTDVDAAIGSQNGIEGNLSKFAYFRDNYGVKVIDNETEDMMQFDVSLADFDALMMNQYQLVASIVNVPVTKLLGTTPKGFNSTGEYEEASYHEELESIQTHDLEPLLDRHYLLLMKSEIEPKFGVSFDFDIVWNPLDAITEKEQAEINLIKSQSDANYVNMGAVDGEIVHNKLMQDETSGYFNLDIDEAEYEESEVNKEENEMGRTEKESNSKGYNLTS